MHHGCAIGGVCLGGRDKHRRGPAMSRRQRPAVGDPRTHVIIPGPITRTTEPIASINGEARESTSPDCQRMSRSESVQRPGLRLRPARSKPCRHPGPVLCHSLVHHTEHAAAAAQPVLRRGGGGAVISWPALAFLLVVSVLGHYRGRWAPIYEVNQNPTCQWPLTHRQASSAFKCESRATRGSGSGVRACRRPRNWLTARQRST